MDDKTKGPLKEAEGKLTGDKERQQQGKDQKNWGKIKDTAGDAKDKVKDKLD